LNSNTSRLRRNQKTCVSFQLSALSIQLSGLAKDVPQ
jgi:hypothetical protein